MFPSQGLMQEQSHNSKTQNIGKGYTMNKMNSIVHLLMHNTTHISNTLRYISNEQNAFSNTLAIRDVSCVLCHFSFYTRTTIINVNSISANRTELPCAKYKIRDCVYVCTYVCTTLHTNVQWYSAVCFMHEEYTYACEGTITVSC